MKPLVSIILPTYNGAQYIASAIESVLAQTYLDWELLIISDGSTDQTRTVVEKFAKHESRIVFVENEKNVGIQKTLNKGIAAAKGIYIARLDDDDCWIEREKLLQQVIYFETHPKCVLVGTNATVINTQGKILSHNTMPLGDRIIRSKILSKNCFLHATVMIKKVALEKVGGYSDHKKFLHVEDYELWLRLGIVGSLANLALYSTSLINREESLTSKNRVGQAYNALRVVWMYKKKYPNFYSGITISTLRYVGFVVISIIPIPHSWLLGIQRIYRAI